MEEAVERLTAEHGVVIFSTTGCCLCYAVNVLFQKLGVTPHVHIVDTDHRDGGGDVRSALASATDWANSDPLPAVFIGGKLVGSTSEVMALHLSGSLLPLLGPYRRQ
ncbi:unnamed protein product [Cuscuta campestris]|uniref:Glutaredoxin domain-containing protein n=1 Tax=Cuscuta campestris TaxID=132261 RepID=A0A484LQ62_9ASTE|nr:unnamed protein product [Cuscuta campestris]